MKSTFVLAHESKKKDGSDGDGEVYREGLKLRAPLVAAILNMSKKDDRNESPCSLQGKESRFDFFKKETNPNKDDEASDQTTFKQLTLEQAIPPDRIDPSQVPKCLNECTQKRTSTSADLDKVEAQIGVNVHSTINSAALIACIAIIAEEAAETVVASRLHIDCLILGGVRKE
ncbi:hypothetical protein Tco_1185382 [Tanacetum coccineum]